MAAGVESLRKALGALKDSTLVGLAKVNGAKKGLDIAIVKATNHDEALANEKYMRIILNAVSASSPRTLISYCIHGLAKRLDKTHNWTVALKSLLVIHRALWEVGHPFCEELVIYSQRRGHILNLSHFKDESSTKAWDYSAWVRNYALYLEERLECFCTLKYEVDTVQQELDTPDLLEQLPALQQLLSRLLGCQPQGASMHNSLIQYALSIVANEGVKLYVTITDGIVSLVDTFFEMRHQDAVMALEIYRKSGMQAERLSEFYEICRALDFGQRQNFIKIEPLPAKFIATMENHVKEAPCTLMLECTVSAAPKEIADPEGGIVKDSYKLDVEGKMVAPETSPVVPNKEHMAAETPQIPNLLDGGFEGLTPDSLYGYPKKIIPTQNEFMNNVWQVTSNPFEVVNCDEDPFYACSNVAPPTDVQMAAMAKQQNLMLHQQEGQDFPIGDKINPFGNPFVNMTVASLHRPQNSYSGLI